MPEGKKSFVLYHDMREPLQLLTDEQRGKLLLALLDYSEFGAIPSFTDSGLSMAFMFIRQTLDRDAAAWEDVRRKRAEAGRKGAEVTNGKRRHVSASVGIAEPGTAKSAVSVNDSVNVNDSVSVSESATHKCADKPLKRSKFTPPSVEDVTGYAQETGLTLDAGAFCDYYAARGWKVGNASMKDWKAAARNWSRREGKQPAAQTRNAIPGADEYTGW